MATTMSKEIFDLNKALSKMRILAVDDMVEARTALKKMMVTLGAKQIDVCNDGEEAANYIKANDYQLIISDYNLGKGKDGQQVLEEAKFTGRLKAGATYIMLTGESTPEMVMGALEYEPDDYITKPFTVEIVKKRLTRILKIKTDLSPVTEAIDKQNLTLALKEADNLLNLFPKLIFKILRLKTRILMEMEDYPQALIDFEKVLALRELPWASLGKARCLVNEKNYDHSIKILKSCLDAYPKYVQCYDELARISILESRLEEAQSYLQKGISLSPKALLRQSELGKIAFENEDLPIAEAALKQAIRLSKNSVHNDPKMVLMYAKSMQYKIDAKNSKESSSATKEVLKTINEGKNNYKMNDEFQLEATIIESNTFVKSGNGEEALLKSKEAEKLLDSMKDAPIDIQLAMAENFIKTHQPQKSSQLINKLEEQGLLDEDIAYKAHSLKQNLSTEEARQYSTEINDKAIELYEQGNLSKAIHLFNQAVAYQEAGASVLLNAIQAKISYMESKTFDKNMLDECKELFNRLGNLDKSDERFSRFLKLKESFDALTND